MLKALQHIKSWLGIYLQKRLLIIALLGFASGIPLFLTSSTLTFWLEELGYDYASNSFFAIASLPYALKFLWAPFIDRLSLPYFTKRFGRRRGWMILSQVLLMACLVGYWVFGPSIKLTLLTTFFAATQVVLMLTYQMESLERKQYGPGDAIGVLGARIGMIVSGAGALYLSAIIPWGAVYAVMAACVGIGLITTLLIEEPQPIINKESKNQELKIDEYLKSHPRLNKKSATILSWIYAAVICPFTDFMKQKGWLAALLIMFIYKFSDNIIGSMPNLMYLELGYSKLEIANATKVFGIIASMLGGLIGGIIVVRHGFLRSLLFCDGVHILASFMYMATYYYGYDLTFLYIAIALEHVTAGMRTTALFSYQLVLSNPMYAATQLALLTSIVDLGRTTFAPLSGYIVEQFGWIQLYQIAILGSIPSLMLCFYLMRISGESLFKRQPLAQNI